MHSHLGSFLAVTEAQNHRCSSTPAVNAWIASILSSRFWRRWAGFLEGIYQIAQDALAKERLEAPSIYDVAWAAQQSSDEQFQPRVFEHPDRKTGVEIDEHVNIAIRPRLAPRGRTKH